MHYNPISRVNIDPDTYSILALEHEYQNTMGQRVGHSFKDIKLLNRLYCTIDYPFTSSLSKSINFGCETKEYELNGGKCKNGGYPDPLKNCACRCPEGHGGRYCTEYKYENCKAVELTAKVKKQAISTTDFSCLYVVKAKQANDKIKAKRILINVETILFQCNHPCQDNYIEIKYLKDKSATGARICCNLKIMPLTITAEASTDVLIMRKGFGAYVISYQIELAPHKESSSCKEIRESIFDPEYHKYAPGIGHWDNGKWVEAKPIRDNTYIVNGVYYPRNWCVENSNPDPQCRYAGCYYCMEVEGSNQPNWYWKNPEGEFILVTRIACFPTKDLNKGK
ncbi:hypothetical protein ACQ4LE_008392 [Meloidogyne hapla]